MTQKNKRKVKYKLIISLWIFGISSFVFLFSKFIRMTFSGDPSYLMTWWFVPLSMFGFLGTLQAYLLTKDWIEKIK